MDEPKLNHGTVPIKQLVADYRAGRIVIPEFQREYVWRKSRAPQLIDSLYRGFPISSLLIWEGTEDVRARRREPHPAGRGRMSWLIDGQQRVITLYRTLSGDEGIDVVFNPDSEEFRLANAATRKDRSWHRLSEVWDDGDYRLIRRNLDGSHIDDHWESRFDRVRRILDYEVPVVRMVDHSFDAAVRAFTRINTLGVRLKREDIESAKVAAKHSGFIADRVVPFLKKIRDRGFVRMNVMHLFRACAFIAHPDGRNRTPLHELDSRTVESAWSRTEKATTDAIALIASELGLVNMNILWSGALVVPLIAICATVKPKDRDAKQMSGWLALAALHHRYSGTSETSLDQDLRACRQNDPIRGLLANLKDKRPDLLARSSDFGGSLLDRGGLLALYVACMHRGAIDFQSGAKIFCQPDLDRHHILPRGQFDERERSRADCVANIAFVNGAVNKSIGLTGPEIYLRKTPTDVLQSQCIPTHESSWAIDHADEFWDARRELLAAAFNDFVEKSFPSRRL